jgi:DNA-binding NarL/FixJ family response regulator
MLRLTVRAADPWDGELSQLREHVSPREKTRKEASAPRKYRPVALDLVSEYTHDLAMGPEEARIARETLADLLALASDRKRKIIRLRLAGSSTAEIANQLGCTDRSVRRYLDALYQRACAAGIVQAGQGPELALVPSANATADEAPLAKAA